MKILIADDEKYVRIGLKSMLLDLNQPLSIKEAVNGAELIKLAMSWQPDMALVDIKMPKINGLEAIKTLKKTNTSTKWYILTTHTKFDYAKEAIELNVIDYLLKPVKPEQLKKIIQRVSEIIKTQAIIKNHEIENKISSIFNNISSLEEYDSLNINKYYKSLIIVFDSSLGEKEQLDYQRRIYNYLKDTIVDFVSNCINIVLVLSDNGELSVLAIWDNIDYDNLRIIRKFFNKIIKDLQQFNRSTFYLTLFETDIYSSLFMLNKQTRRIMVLEYLRLVMNKRASIVFKDLLQCSMTTPDDLGSFCISLIELTEAYKEKSYLNYMKKIEILEKLAFKLDIKSCSQQIRSINRYLLTALNFNQNIIVNNRIEIGKLKSLGNRLLRLKKASKNGHSNLIKKVMDFIDNNFMYDIGIAQIAYQLNITPNYLSYLFHKSAGMTFMKYLTQIRMLKAKELLLTGAKIKEVAFQVGYLNPNHFTKMFKKYWNFTPSFFQKLNRRRSYINNQD